MLVFIHINKTAGRTVRYILRSSFGLRHCEVEPWHAPGQIRPFRAMICSACAGFTPTWKALAAIASPAMSICRRTAQSLGISLSCVTPQDMRIRFQYNVQYRGRKTLSLKSGSSRIGRVTSKRR